MEAGPPPLHQMCQLHHPLYIIRDDINKKQPRPTTVSIRNLKPPHLISAKPLSVMLTDLKYSQKRRFLCFYDRTHAKTALRPGIRRISVARKDGTDTCGPVSRDTSQEGWDGNLQTSVQRYQLAKMGRKPVDQCLEILAREDGTVTCIPVSSQRYQQKVGRIPVDQCLEILVRKNGTDTCRPVQCLEILARKDGTDTCGPVFRDTSKEGWDG